ncbi:hypothetical protein [Micromonospora musae]|uniref:hypothetical protein n=1 Tax=Micromonospora musae TaxID=1894970 RepID=UPI0011C48D4C|nr:hypothetical protein [Micromonospora musae]
MTIRNPFSCIVADLEGHVSEYALANEIDHPRDIYLREDALTDPLDTWLATAFTPGHLRTTITAMTDAQLANQPAPAVAAAHATIAERDAKLAPPSRPRRRSRPLSRQHVERLGRVSKSDGACR